LDRPEKIFRWKTTAYAGLSAFIMFRSSGFIFAYFLFRDAITPNQDFIICAHPHSQGLYIATGGSFHGWKFFPILGKYVVQMLEGTLSPALAKIWAWDRSDNGSAHSAVIPHREMKDV
jgi:sarcosine oxidase / L-pipecolate oxidase